MVCGWGGGFRSEDETSSIHSRSDFHGRLEISVETLKNPLAAS